MSTVKIHHRDDVSNSRPKIGILCLSAIPDDPRVRRQGNLFTAAGWEVVAIGLPGHHSSDPDWTCLAIDLDNRNAKPSGTTSRGEIVGLNQECVAFSGGTPGMVTDRWTTTLTNSRSTQARMVGGVARRLLEQLPALVQDFIRLGRTNIEKTWKPVTRKVGIVLRTARLSYQPSHAETAYWQANDRFQRIYELARPHHVDIWLGNDWTTLPIAARLAAEQGVPFAYDTHELAYDEYAQSFKWRIVHRPLIKHAEGASIHCASFVTCVSDGIADRLVEVHGLAHRPVVIRNTPHFQACPFRPTGDVVKVLYHGIVAPGRGLEDCIRSVASWRTEFELIIRGPSPEDYLASLKAIAAEEGVENRVTFDPPVPMTELVSRAASCDVGLFALPAHSQQNVYVLPNKFFEYTMAGLALVVSDLPEMTRLLREHDLGLLISELTPSAIAKAVNALDRAAIDRYKANALEAAKELNWEVEGARLTEICAAATKPRTVQH